MGIARVDDPGYFSFHVKPYWARAAEHIGIDLSEGQRDRLTRYGEWLAEEGVPAGGLGPGEMGRIDRRHLADSLLFATVFPDEVNEVWDLGSGVGLPGIPLAIAFPQTDFTLLDRSGRRVDLMRRVLRILDLGNCHVVQGEAGIIPDLSQVIVSRASLSPDALADTVYPRLAPGGMIVAGGSWEQKPSHPGWETVEIPGDVLDQTIWILIMRRE